MPLVVGKQARVFTRWQRKQIVPNQHIVQKRLKEHRFLLAEQCDADGMQREIGKRGLTAILPQQIFTHFPSLLLQQNFEEDVGIDQDSSRHSDALC